MSTTLKLSLIHILNAAMKANPYVLAATLIVGAATAMWALHDSTTAAERAQKKYNKTKADSLQKEEEHKSRLENLIAVSYTHLDVYKRQVYRFFYVFKCPL